MKQDLDELRKAFKEGKFFNFSKLIQSYGINDDNPICVESLAPPTVLQPNPAPQEEIHPLRKWRWDQINEVLTKHQEQKQASKTDNAHRSGDNDIGITTTYSETQWIKLGDIFEEQLGDIFGEHLGYYTESISPIPASDLCTLSTLLSWIYSCFGDLTGHLDSKMKRAHLIAPVLWTVIHSLPGVVVNIEQQLNGKRVKASGRVEFILRSGTKRICIVEAKRMSFEQGVAQCLLGCGVAADLDNSHEIFGIVTNYTEWMFIKSRDEQILIDNESELSFKDGVPNQAELEQVVGKLRSLLA